MQLGRKSHVWVLYVFFLNLFLEQMSSVEELKQQSYDEPDSDSKFEDEPTEEENQNDTSSIEMQEETRSGGSLGKLRPKPAYLSSKQKSQKQSLLAAISDSWFRSQKIRPSHIEKSDLCNIVMVSSMTRLPLCISTAFVPQLWYFFFLHLCLTP